MQAVRQGKARGEKPQQHLDRQCAEGEHTPLHIVAAASLWASRCANSFSMRDCISSCPPAPPTTACCQFALWRCGAAPHHSGCLCIACCACCAVPTCASIQPAGPRTGRVALRVQALQQGCWRLQQAPQLLSCQPGGAPARRESRQEAASTGWRIAEQAGRGALLHGAGAGGS